MPHGLYSITLDPLTHSKSNDDWEIIEVGGFLRKVSYGEDSTLNFKCTHSDEVYQQYSRHMGDYSYDFSLACSNDPFFYQACSLDGPAGFIEISDGRTACGKFICSTTLQTFYGYQESHWSSTYLDVLGTRCNNISDCDNTYLDEIISCEREEGFVVLPSGKSVLNDTICDGQCDMWNCEDEADCNGYRYGVYCDTDYYNPTLACNSVMNCPAHFQERCVVTNETQFSCQRHVDKYWVYALHDNFRCAAILSLEPYCHNYLDQSNCSDPTTVGILCNIRGYN